METTDYVLSIIAAHPTMSSIYLSQQVFHTTFRDQLPQAISIQEWNEDWCEGRNESGEILVHFKV